MNLETHSPLIVGLTGAFERDNFGDLLYPMLLNSVWGNDLKVRLLSRFPADTEELLGLSVSDLDSSLLTSQFDALILAGGASVPIPMDRAALLLNVTPEAASLDPFGLPYVPEVRRSRLNSATPVFINSVSLWPKLNLRMQHNRRMLEALKGAQGITVRDSPSLDLARQWGVQARLVPDIIHALSLAWPNLGRDVKDQVAVQISDEYLDDQGFEAVLHGLVNAANEAAAQGLRSMVLFAAGVAPRHDDLEKISTLAERMRTELEGVEILVSYERDPKKIVQIIAESRLVIGHSLHVRIVAASYHVPRISLQRKKTEIYAGDWDPAMPSGIPADRLVEAVRQALDSDVIATARNDSESLNLHAMGMIKDLEVSIKTWASAREAVTAQRRNVQLQQRIKTPRESAAAAARRVRAWKQSAKIRLTGSSS